MRRLRREDASAVSRRRQRARAIWRRIAAFVVYLLHYQLLPEKRLVELMADLLGVKLVAATIARMSRTAPGVFGASPMSCETCRSAAGQAHG